MRPIKLIIATLYSLLLLPALSRSADFPVYPLPQEIELTGASLDLSEAEILFYNGPGDKLGLLARQLSEDVAKRFLAPLTWRRAENNSGGRPAINIGLSSDPQIQKLLDQSGRKTSLDWEVAEGYRLVVGQSGAVIAGHDLRGLFYGVQSFIQLIESPEPGKAVARGAAISDRPFKPVRGVHVYLPARKDLPFFKNYIQTMAHYKINTLILEVGGGMRLDRHPEINTAWENFTRSFYDMGDPMQKYGEQVPLGPHNRFQASVHTELGGGSWLTKEEVRELAEFAREHYVDVVPEIQSLTHTYYLTLAHRDIAEIPEAAWPDSYDPSNPKSYDLLFDVIDEYLEVLRPEWVHIGHDEWRAGVKGNTGELYGRDVVKIHHYLKSRGVGTMMWADHLVKGHNMKARIPEAPAEGVWYAYPSTEGAAEIISAQARDILMLNWSWGVDPTSDAQLRDHGWTQIFGNFDGARQYEKWHDRLAQPGVLGAEMSTWCLADESSYGQNGSLLNMLFSQSLLWSDRVRPSREVFEHLAASTPGIRELLSGNRLPSVEVLRKRPGYLFATFRISATGNAGRKGEMSGVPSGEVSCDDLPFSLAAGDKAFVSVRAGEEVRGIPVETNAASLVFLHVSTKAGENLNTYHSNYPLDTAELLGYYRIRYADGLEEVLPVRYGRNISHAGGDFADQVYFARTVNLQPADGGKPVLAYACEWVNPRPNRRIKAVDLVGVDNKSGAYPVLLAVTAVKPPFEE